MNIRERSPGTATSTARSTPAVAHAIAILELLRARAPAQVGLSEIARTLGLSKASCYTILQTLHRSRYVVQDPIERSYTLGPALLGLAAAVTGDSLAIAVARKALPRLVAATGFPANAWKRMAGDYMTIVARDEGPRPIRVSETVGIGTHVPITPWSGGVFLAWLPPAEIERWFDRAAASGHAIPQADRRAGRETLRAIAARGYEISIKLFWPSPAATAEGERWLEQAAAIGLDVRSVAARQASLAAARRMSAPHPEMPITGHGGPPITLVSLVAPVFDFERRVTMALSTFGFTAELPPERVPAIAAHVRAIADQVTAAIGGERPCSATA